MNEDYKYTRNRVTRFYNNKDMSDKEIIEALSKEIEQYRNRIRMLEGHTCKVIDDSKSQGYVIMATSNEETTMEQMVDYITETFYADEKIIKEVTTYFK